MITTRRQFTIRTRTERTAEGQMVVEVTEKRVDRVIARDALRKMAEVLGWKIVASQKQSVVVEYEGSFTAAMKDARHQIGLAVASRVGIPADMVA